MRKDDQRIVGGSKHERNTRDLIVVLSSVKSFHNYGADRQADPYNMGCLDLAKAQINEPLQGQDISKPGREIARTSQRVRMCVQEKANAR